MLFCLFVCFTNSAMCSGEKFQSCKAKMQYCCV
uniref:Beta-defensin n=1 Tax=Anguilla anguilla TaxID=7936 RepID=A0A0E9Q1A2_ANGAN